MGVELLASPSAGAMCYGHASFCASVPSRMGGACSRICIERELGSIVAVTPVAVEVWTLSW
jgi:hypothetical protein